MVKPEQPILEVLEIIDRGALRVAIVTDEEQKLLGIVTDGDVRRGFLRGVDMSAAVKEIMSSDVTVASIHDTLDSLLNSMRQHELNHIPIVDDQGRVVGLETLAGLIKPVVQENLVVLMAGGLGTRLRPLTQDCPKPLLRVGTKPILETIIQNFADYGYKKFCLAVNYKAHMIKDYFSNGAALGVEISYLEENKRLGTAGALSLLGGEVNRPVIVMNGDVMAKVNLKGLLAFHQQQQVKATMCVWEHELQLPYGVVKIHGNRIKNIEEKPLQSYLVNAGIYVLSPEVIGSIPKDTYYDMTSLFHDLIAKGEMTAAFPLREYWIDMGHIDDYKRAVGDSNERF
jgi:dTDP-glucose pyrophosphorylase